MTTINRESPTIRETVTLYKGRPILIELHPGFMVLRVKGLRAKHMLSYDGALEFAAQREARLLRQDSEADKPRRVSRGILKLKGI